MAILLHFGLAGWGASVDGVLVESTRIREYRSTDVMVTVTLAVDHTTDCIGRIILLDTDGSRSALGERLRRGVFASRAMVDSVGLGVAFLGKIEAADRTFARAGALVVAASVVSVAHNAMTFLAFLQIGRLGARSRAIHDRIRGKFALWRER